MCAIVITFTINYYKNKEITCIINELNVKGLKKNDYIIKKINFSVIKAGQNSE